MLPHNKVLACISKQDTRDHRKLGGDIDPVHLCEGVSGKEDWGYCSSSNGCVWPEQMLFVSANHWRSKHHDCQNKILQSPALHGVQLNPCAQARLHAQRPLPPNTESEQSVNLWNIEHASSRPPRFWSWIFSSRHAIKASLSPI